MTTYFINRLREPSTYSGLAALLLALGLNLPGGLLEAVTQLGIGLAGIISILLPEQRH
jgi:hypothetical protein